MKITLKLKDKIEYECVGIDFLFHRVHFQWMLLDSTSMVEILAHTDLVSHIFLQFRFHFRIFGFVLDL